MVVSANEVRRQLRMGEDSRWEFKRIEFRGDRPIGPRRDALANELSAFANASGGVLVCGVTDAGEAQGMTRPQLDAMERLVLGICADSIKPPIDVETFRLDPDGKAVLAVSVARGYALHRSPGGHYRRVGSSKRRLSSDLALRLAQQRGQARFRSFDQRTITATGPETLDESLWKPLLSAEGASDPESALAKQGLLAPDEAGVLRATVAGVLTCTPAPERWLPGAAITATRYRGTDRASGQLDAQRITGPVRRQIEEAVAFAIRNMRVAARKDPARVDLPQYSQRAIFEAVVNAVAHRDYAIRASRIRLSMFEDRLEIQSPGSLPNSLTVESISMRQATRNEALVSVLGRMPVGGIAGSERRRFLMERRGDGVPIIRRETRALAGRLPEYRLLDDSELLLVLPAAHQERTAGRVVVTVRSAGQPLPGSEVLALFPNRTWRRATTDEEGEAAIELHSTHLPMTVYAAAPGYAAHVEREWVPSRRALAMELASLPGGGAAILPEAAGHLPGLRGRLNPILDDLDRTWLYASNIAIDGGKPQPVHFTRGEPLRLTDAHGFELEVRIVDIAGRSALVEYRPPPKKPERG